MCPDEQMSELAFEPQSVSITDDLKLPLREETVINLSLIPRKRPQLLEG